MAVLENFMPSGHFKQELHDPIDFGQMLPSSGPHKPRRPQLPRRRIEDYNYFVALVVVEDGSIQMRSSKEMKGYKHVVLEDALIKFGEIMNDYVHLPVPPKRHHSVADSMLPLDSSLSHKSRRIAKPRPQGVFSRFEQPQFSRSELKLESNQPTQSMRQLQIRVDDLQAQANWFSDAFKAVQQVGCRAIAKVWIKKIHPKKQSTHPYNGGFPRDQEADPDRTRPPYWPAEVIHKEPDHIDRNARTALLVHLIMNTPQEQIKGPAPQDTQTFINAKELFAALEEKRNDFKQDRWTIISEIIRARSQIEMYEGGGFDGDATIYVPDLSERSARGDQDGEGDENEVSASEQLSAGKESEDGQDTDNIGTPQASVPSSPTSRAQNDKPKPRRRRQEQSSNNVDKAVVSQAVNNHNSDTYNPLMHDFPHVTSEQECSAMTIDSVPFTEPKGRGPSHRLHHLQVPHGAPEFPADHHRQQPGHLSQQWLGAESMTGYVSNGYAMENLHSHTPMSAQSFDSGLFHSSMQDMSLPNGLPALDGIVYNALPVHPRSLPHRALPTPQPLMLESEMHGHPGLGVIQHAGNFYTS